MAKRVFIIHCWGSGPDDHWYPWLREELAKRGFAVHAPQMPGTEAPRITAWVAALQKIVGTIDDDTYFIGHSIGCQAIIRYLAAQKTHCGGAVFVAGWFTLTGLESAKEEAIAKSWLHDPINLERAKRSMKSSVAILSDNDPYVELKSNAEMFRKNLGSKVIIEKGKGHFDDAAGKQKPTAALKDIMIMAR